VLISGNFFKKVKPEELTFDKTNVLSTRICEKGLRYDLTVPFARYVVQYQNDIAFPFKRYQIQPVWRADRPQKGRYREFYQCDVDVIGSNSLLNEVELILIINEVFGKLGVNSTVKINNRKILSGMVEVVGESDKLIDITVAIDKIDKIGIDAVNKELAEKGVAQQAIAQLQPIIELKGNAKEKLETLSKFLQSSEMGMKGIVEMQEVFNTIEGLSGLNVSVELDLSLARGLNYYTGAIFEVKANDMDMGSICGGGRYDDLTGIFGLKNVSGVGISFGADRIYDVMLQLNLCPESLLVSTQVMFANFGPKEAAYCLPLAQQLRESQVSSEVYPDSSKMKKQFDYANKKNIKYVVIVGESEMNNGEVSVKDMQTGNQETIPVNKLVSFIKE